MIAAIVIGVLAVATIAYVIAPIGRLKTPLEEADSESPAEEKKRVALTGILDLEEERDGGKLSEDEFADLRARYEQDAVRALEEIDGSGAEDDLEARLEREIAGARDKLRCGTCGAPRSSDATRCPSCGSSF